MFITAPNNFYRDKGIKPYNFSTKSTKVINHIGWSKQMKA